MLKLSKYSHHCNQMTRDGDVVNHQALNHNYDKATLNSITVLGLCGLRDEE